MFKMMRNVMLSPEGSVGGSESVQNPVSDPSKANQPGKDETGVKNDSKPSKTYTQEEVNALLAKEKRQGKNSVLKALGLQSVDEGKAAIEAAQKAANANKTAEEVAAEALNAEKTARSKAESDLTVAQRTIAVMKAGFKPEYVDDVVAIASVKVTEDKDFDAVIEDMKKTHQFYLVEQKKEDPGTGTPVAGFKKTEKNSTEKTYGQRLAENKVAEFQKANKVNFFKN